MRSTEYTDPDDRLLRELFSQIPLEKAPENFTSGIMQQVYTGFETVGESPETRRQVLMGYATLLAAIVIVGLMLFAQWPFLKLNFLSDFVQLKSLLNVSLGILDGIKNFTSFLKESSTVIIILAAIGLLLLFERIIRKEFNHIRTSII